MEPLGGVDRVGGGGHDGGDGGGRRATGIRRDTISSTLSGSPERSTSTVPSRRLRTQPASPSARAVSTVQSRKKTPCTRPFTTTRTALGAAGDGCGEGSAADAAMPRRAALAVKGRRKRGAVAQVEVGLGTF